MQFVTQLTPRGRTQSLLGFCLWLLSACSVAAPERGLQGSWVNTDGGHRLQLDLKANNECVLTVERAFNAARSSPCQFQVNEQQLSIFIKNGQGECGDTADFSAHFQPERELLVLDAEPQAIELHRQ